ncbi:MAG: tRNA (adenosine(37)-N6)-threonylcarbamoyltransferase complex ATPase subunit type 1 TsaE [Anaerovoracaceae bacterium]|nr:tRNA (adenosine(37)-N6)-threonylcarbamoyltransferase complex ATPase subunit type 1 TsaE [Bacillota bacterium]MDY2671496.1 tRNA (adenosine(37)-N6)-threonylcarbamoyltransferase complex ATPase subunit type 1 TsaE [Anaerovoracaceae bacterium]
MRVKTENEQDTRRLGASFADKLKPGDIVCLLGDLGTGKTTFSKAVAAGLGVKEEITSPTFNIVNIYKSGRIPLYHFDVYRLSGAKEFLDAGFDEYFDAGGVCLIEWADIIEDVIPDGSILVEIERGSSETERLYDISYI